MALYERMQAPRWKKIRGFSNYEISEEGQIRNVKRPKDILARYWVSGSSDNPCEYAPEHERDPELPGSLCVHLSRDGNETTRRIWRLMEDHWPNAHYPDNWKEEKHRAGSNTNLSKEKVREIIASTDRTSVAAKKFDVSVGTIRYHRQLKSQVSREIVREEPELADVEYDEYDDHDSLGEEMVEKIIRSPKSGRKLAKELDIAYTTVHRVRRGDTLEAMEFLEEHTEYVNGWREHDLT